MSEQIRYEEMVQINNPGNVLEGPDWLRSRVGHAYTGFVFNGNGYDYGNWVCLLSNGEIHIHTDAFLKMMAASVPAMIKAGLVASAVTDEAAWYGRFITAFNDGTPLIYVKPDLDGGDDGADIVVLERAPHRDPISEEIHTRKTWIIIASEYGSGRTVEGLRLSFFMEKLKDLNIDYVLGSRGPELK